MSLQILAGVEEVSKSVLAPYDEHICDFLNDWSVLLRNDAEAKTYPDVMSFSFWCRKGNILQLKEAYEKREPGCRIGRGMIFHIAPSNVAVNAAFTYVFGLLAGNANVVRVSSKKHPQIICLCRVLSQVLHRCEYQDIFQITSFVTYDREEDYTASYSTACDARVIWGGDDTIQTVRRISIPVRAVEVTFADRYSFGILDGEYLETLDDAGWRALVHGFYNDTYLMDQNACSTPHLLFWIHADSEIKEKFWQMVYEKTLQYDLLEQKVSDKYTQLNEISALQPEITKITRYKNYLYVIDLVREKMSKDASLCYRGKFGMFFQTDLHTLDELPDFLDNRVQTCAVAGINPQKIKDIIFERKCFGIDRIVPFGKTLDIGVVWDGYDMIQQLSRVIV